MTSPSREKLMGDTQGPPRPGLCQTHTHRTHTQVPGVQLHLLLQLCQELVVEGLELQGERKHSGLGESSREGTAAGLHRLRAARDTLRERPAGLKRMPKQCRPMRA